MAAHNPYVSVHQDQDLEFEYPPDTKVLRNNTTIIVKAVDPLPLMRILACFTPLEEEKIIAKHNQLGRMHATMELLELLVRRKGYWDNFLKALRNDLIMLDDLADSLEKELETFKRENEEEVKAFTLSVEERNVGTSKKRKLSFEDNSTERSVKQSRESSDSDEDFKDCVEDPSDLEKVTKKVKHLNVDGINIEFLDISKSRTPRKYQLALAKPAQDGSNTIICAPTGSGKTMVASLIIKSHIEKMLPNDSVKYDLPCGSEHQVIADEAHSPDDALDTGKVLVYRCNGNTSDNLSTTMPDETEIADEAHAPDDALDTGKVLVYRCNGNKSDNLSTTIMTEETESYQTAKCSLGLQMMNLSALDNMGIQRPKILVIVPRFAILLHVYRELKTALPMWNIAKKSGADNPNVKRNLAQLFKNNHVVVVTADIFKNAILLGVEKCMEVTDPTLIIFDECHYTMNDHSYNIIMTEYLKVKHNNPSAMLPQIVGLSASPGAGKKVIVLEAQDNILTLCANMDTEVFETVREEHREELEQFVQTPTKHMNIVSSRPNNPFTNEVMDLMKELEVLAEIESVAPERGTQEYESLLSLRLDAAIQLVQNDKRKVIEQLFTYNRALILVKLARMIDGYNFLNAEFTKLKLRKINGSLDKIDTKLLQLYEDHDEKLKEAADLESRYPNPKLVQLKKGIIHQKQDGQFRGIIFVKTKLLAMALREWMKDDADLSTMNPEILTSIHADRESGGTTHAEQTATLKRFETGETEVLISTSVGEEGIDIPECHMVIKYNHVTNEIAMVQSRGRARKTNAVELVIGDETVAEKDKVNVLLEEIMETAITAVQNMNKGKFQERIHSIQKEQLKKRQDKEKRLQDLQNENKAEDIELKCKGCNKFVCNVSDIRIYGKCSYINPDLEFKKKIIIQTSKSPKKREIGQDEVYCAGCNYKWGITVDGYPCLGLKSFLIEINRSGKSVKQWSKMPCTIRKF